MKVLLCAPNHLPQIGGRELVVHHLAVQYQALGHQVLVAGPAGWLRYRKHTFDYPVQRWPRMPGVSRDASDWLAMSLTQVLGRFDVIHAHTTYPSAYAAARISHWSEAPLVVTPHGEDINVVPELRFGARLDPVRRRKIEFALRRARRATAISDTIAGSLLEAGVPGSRIVRIPNGVDLERFQRRHSFDVRAHLGIPPECFLVVSVGNYHPRKGHEFLIEGVRRAIARGVRVCLVIVGRPSESLTSEVTRSGIAHDVRFLGILPLPLPAHDGPDVLAALMQSAQVYVSASADEGAEGLSLALLEAMAAGAGPVVTDISGNRDVIAHGDNGLVVQPREPEAIADALVQLAGHPGRLAQIRRRACETTVAFGWRSIAERYLALYREVVDEVLAGVRAVNGRTLNGR